MIQRLARRYDTRVLEQLLLPARGDARAIHGSLPGSTAWAAGLQKSVDGDRQMATASSIASTLQPTTRASRASAIRRARHGVDERVGAGRCGSSSCPSTARSRMLANSLQGLVGDDSYVVRGDQRRDVASFREAMDWLMAEARRGQTIQRYKGLGEMNPEQLWETTVNPETPTADAGAHRGRGGSGRDLHHADGRSGRTAPRVHRAQRARSRESRHLATQLHRPTARIFATWASTQDWISLVDLPRVAAGRVYRRLRCGRSRCRAVSPSPAAASSPPRRGPPAPAAGPPPGPAARRSGRSAGFPRAAPACLPERSSPSDLPPAGPCPSTAPGRSALLARRRDRWQSAGWRPDGPAQERCPEQFVLQHPALARETAGTAPAFRRQRSA